MKQTRQLFVAALLTWALACVALNAADNTVGTWKLNLDKSKFDPSPPLKSATSTRESSEGGVKVTTTGELADGTPLNSSYTAKYDGTDSPVTGAPWDTIALKHVSANTYTSTSKKGGKLYGNARTVISNGGKTMTTTSNGTNAEGKKFHYVMVYDKQ